MGKTADFLSEQPLPAFMKRRHMRELDEFKRGLWNKPQLRSLFLELTLACNERCRHCGSCAGEPATQRPAPGDRPLSAKEWMDFIDEAAAEFDQRKTRLCITGGEPMLHPHFFEIMEHAHDAGWTWGMTSNGTFIDEATAERLRRAGMTTISVSIDGLPETHDWFRQTPGAYESAERAVRALVDNGGFKHVQVTTVVHRRNYDELPALHERVRALGVRSWRVINVDPIGRAKDNPELLLTDAQLKGMFDFIAEKRRSALKEGGMPVVYGCSHFLGFDYEREVRDWYFLCNAGIYTASVQYNGDIGACLDIERRPELVEGNIRVDDFAQVWREGFRFYRGDTRKLGPCASCKEYRYCTAGACHTWNFDENRQNVCFKDVLF